MTQLRQLPNPKRNGVEYVGRSTWYPYYAGFSPLFVSSIFDSLCCDKDTVVCDPWNGAGTTTQVAFDRCIPCVGVDLNPAMTQVALARTMLQGDASQLSRLCGAILRQAKRFRWRSVEPHDPLGSWFSHEVVRGVRYLSRAIASNVPTLNRRAHAFYATAMFRTLHTMLAGMRSSNPTWIRQPSRLADRIKGSTLGFIESFGQQVNQMICGLELEPMRMPKRRSAANLLTASSVELPLQDDSVHIVIGSPPYCTRIDYAITTSVELAYLGIDVNGRNRPFRNEMIGTTTIRAVTPIQRSEWGNTCLQFLDAVRHHQSKSSGSYYLKTHLQYYDDLFRSLSEIARVLRPGGDGVLVVQDSFYKDIHNDLPAIAVEMALNLGMLVVQKDDFRVSTDMGRVNPRANKQRRIDRPTESVIHFKKMS